MTHDRNLHDRLAPSLAQKLTEEIRRYVYYVYTLESMREGVFGRPKSWRTSHQVEEAKPPTSTKIVNNGRALARAKKNDKEQKRAIWRERERERKGLKTHINNRFHSDFWILADGVKYKPTHEMQEE